MGSDDPFDDPYYTVYRYTATDASGAPVAQGRLALQFVFNDAVDPRLPIEEDIGFGVSGAREVGVTGASAGASTQGGEGEVGGTVTRGGTLRLDLNQGVADQNVVLTAVDVAPTKAFTGTWSFNTLLGEVERGTFQAEVVRPATQFLIAG